jgi:CRISPR/Cas system-associated exonuclease Cas4 (RecB family)
LRHVRCLRRNALVSYASSPARRREAEGSPVAVGEGIRRAFLKERNRLMELVHSGADPWPSPACSARCHPYGY